MRCFGSGLQKTGVVTNQPTDFTIDAKTAGVAPVKVWCLDQMYNPVDVNVVDNQDGTFQCSYTPTQPVKHSILAAYGGVAVPGSPFRVIGCNIFNAS